MYNQLRQIWNIFSGSWIKCFIFVLAIYKTNRDKYTTDRDKCKTNRDKCTTSSDKCTSLHLKVCIIKSAFSKRDKCISNRDKYKTDSDKYTADRDKFTTNWDICTTNKDKCTTKRDKCTTNRDKYTSLHFQVCIFKQTNIYLTGTNIELIETIIKPTYKYTIDRDKYTTNALTIIYVTRFVLNERYKSWFLLFQ